MPRVVRFASEASVLEYIYYQGGGESIASDSDVSDILPLTAFMQHKELGVDGAEDCLSDVSTESSAGSYTALKDAVLAYQHGEDEQSKKAWNDKEPQCSLSMAAQLKPWMYHLWEDAHQQQVSSLPEYIFQEEKEEDAIALDSDVSDILPATTFVQHKELGVDEAGDCLGDVSTESSAGSCTALTDAMPGYQHGKEEQSEEAWSDKEPQRSLPMVAQPMPCMYDPLEDAQSDKEPQRLPPTVAQLMPCTYDIWENAHPHEVSALKGPGAFEGTAASAGGAAAASACGAPPPWALGAQKMHPMLLKALLRLEAAGVPGAAEKLLQLQGLGSTEPGAPAGSSMATMSS